MFGPGDMGDAFAAELGEMPRGQHGAALIIGKEAACIGILDLRKDVDHRDVAGPRQLRALVGAAGGDDDAVDPLAHELLDVMRLARRIIRGVAHEHRHAAVRQALLDAFHDRDGEAAERVGRDQADSQALAPMQALREIIGAEAELPSPRQ